jgi:hypothetical protein
MSEQPCTSCIDDGITPAQGECDPFYVGGPTPSVDTNPSRLDLAKRLTRKGAIALGIGTLVGVVTMDKALAVTCSCGSITTIAEIQCEYYWCAARNEYRKTGRARQKYRRRYSTGTAGFCGEYCYYWGPWFTSSGTCVYRGCPD